MPMKVASKPGPKHHPNEHRLKIADCLLETGLPTPYFGRVNFWVIELLFWEVNTYD